MPRKGFKKEVARLAAQGSELNGLDEVIVKKAIQESQNEASEEDSTTPAITKADLHELAKAAAASAVEQVTKTFEQERADLISQKEEAEQKAAQAQEEADKKIAAAQEESDQLTRDAVALAQKEAAEQVEAAQEEAKKVKEEADKAKQTVDGLFKLTGTQMPNFNQNTDPINTEPQGLAAELFSLVTDRNLIKTQSVQDPVTKLYANQKNLSGAAKYVAIHFAECAAKGVSWRNAPLLKDVEKFFKAHGFLSGTGKRTNAAGPTIGVPGVAGDVFLDILSVILRQTHNQSNIFWQFTMTAFNSAIAPSQNMLIPRFMNLANPTNIADYELATTSTYTAVQAAIGTNTDSQSLEVTTVPISVTQYGLGKAGTVDTRPIFIPEFHNQLSLIGLLDAVGTRLMQNYYAFEELLIRSQYERATNILYNSGGDAVAAPADVGAGADGTFTEAFANSVYTEMYANQMPTYSDGCYALALSPKAANQYKSSLGDQYRPVTEDQKEAVSNTFRMAHGVEIGHVNGYMGKYNNFHVFAGNSFGVGAAGASPTVNNVAFAGGAQDAEDSFAFAPGCVGRGQALAAEVRASGVNPYNLGESYIWLSREGVAAIDLDATLPNPGTTDLNQQTRCFKLRTSRRPV